MLICPDCNETVRVGFGGKKNLAIHRTSKACRSKQGNKSKGLKRPLERPPKLNQPNQDLRAFFKPCVPLNPPTVVAPPPIHADGTSLGTSFSGLSDNQDLDLETAETCKQVPEETLEEMAGLGAPLGAPPEAPLPPMEAGNTREKPPCRKGIELLNKLEAAVTRIPNNVPLATPAHRLSIFSADPRS